MRYDDAAVIWIIINTTLSDSEVTGCTVSMARQSPVGDGKNADDWYITVERSRLAPTPVAAPPETGVIPIPPGFARTPVEAWQDAYEVMETSGEAHAAVSAPPLTRDDAEMAGEYTELRDIADKVVETFTLWLAYKSDNGYWDGREMDIAFDGEHSLDALHDWLESHPARLRDSRAELVDLRAELIAKSGYGRMVSQHVSRDDLRRWAGVIETALGLGDE